MATDHRSRLAGIRRFDQLVAYLHNEMGWPIDSGDFEDLTFEYTPEELGIDLKNAAKIQEIKRLRPLAANQPWGIFFVKFEPKRLPVVALRRILGQVALKKRASANKSERQAWAADDLLFVSNYGETGDGRRIAFAHFAKPPEGEDLPRLKVLGWDNLDTPLHLDDVAEKLTHDLAWPADPKDAAAWRTRWRGAFTLRHREVVATSKDLSIRLAELARAIRDRIKTALAIETEKGPLTKLMKAFQSALVHDLEPDGFADMYAQTIAYGLLSARIADPHKKTADDFAGHMRTNPFLRELMETFLKVGGRHGRAGGPGIDFDELGVSEVVELLDGANMEAVVRDFGDRNRQEDPVVHFYELFLSEYNKQLKIQRGVFYTPQPVVSYIVHSVHELLQTEFGLADGLADTTTWGEMLKKHPSLKLPPLTDEPGERRTVSPDEPFVQILDPATGTATFLVEVIDVIHRTLAAKWKQECLTDVQQRAAWNEYVPRHLLPRVHAFELMMAPYAIAHMKVGLKLAETGYRFGVEERARIYLTNALEPWAKQLPLIGFDALAHEAAAVNEVKRHKRYTVVIGNPPYSNFGMLNRSPFILGLLEDYKRGLDEKKINLDDDFIKFVRFSQATLATAHVGVLGFITNNVFLDGITHRRMRQSLLKTFSCIRVLDLHGSAKKLETSRDGGEEENVFDIRQGVSIALFVSKPTPAESPIEHADLWGSREFKYHTLESTSASTTAWKPLDPVAPHFFFVPKDFASGAEYSMFPSLADAFTVFQNGLKTDRDELFFDFDRDQLTARMKIFYSKKYRPEFVEQFGVYASSSYDIEARRDQTRFSASKIQKCLYRPFDFRWLYYDPDLTSRPASKVMRHQLGGKNIALVCLRQTRRNEEGAFLVSPNLINKDAVSLFDIGTVFPLYLYEEALGSGLGQEELGLAHGQDRRPNFTAPFLKDWASAMQVPQRGAHSLPAGLTPEDIFEYVYAVLYSSGYRSRYAEFLKIEFPRLPLTGNQALFRALARLGGELTVLHLLESPRLDRPITEFVGARNPEVEKVSWSRDTVWLDKAQTAGFRGVRELVWTFHIGGYQVCEKWLKDRKGRTLSKDDIAHYQKIVVALSETIRLMKEIDEVIDKHGGWPGAFLTDARALRAEVVEIRKKAAYKKPELDAEELPLLKAAEPASEYKPEDPGGKRDRSPRRR